MRVFFLLFFFQLHTLLGRGNEEDIIAFFSDALHCINSLQNADDFHQERLYRELDDHARTLSSFIAALSRHSPENRDTSEILASLYRCILNMLLDYDNRQAQLSTFENLSLPPTVSTGLAGRPRYNITAEQISHCVSIGMTWQRTASWFGISRRNLYRHRQSLGVVPLQYAILSNEELNSIMTTILQNTPNAGETYVLGSLMALHSHQIICRYTYKKHK